ncbi:hypothetical protein ABBQ32_009187 [Trebouxia sp. C0010 RCD-2024]
MSGILDMKWQPVQPARLLAACADGSLHVLMVQPDDKAIHVTRQQAVKASDTMALSLDINDLGRQVISSSSDGSLSVLQASESAMSVTAQWHGHDLEAWNVAFDRWQDKVVYSGADDCMLKGWDLRQPGSAPTFVNRKSHTAGVCCIASSPRQEHCLLTGSYDEHIRMWDSRKLEAPLAEVSTGGGVWRLKWHPSDPVQVLAACMHNGFVVVQADASTGNIRVVEEYPHQKSLGYGADWCSLPTGPFSIAATCSFYDRLLHLWSPQTLCSDLTQSSS